MTIARKAPIKRLCDMPMTDAQLQLLNYLRDEMQGGAKAPTQNEIAAHFGVSRSTVRQRINALERKRHIIIYPGHGNIEVQNED